MLKYSVVGIGFNLNQTRFLSDAPNPVSLKSLTGESYNLRQELELLLKHIFEEYDKVIPSAGQEEQFSKATADLERRYTALLYRLGEYHNYIDRRSGKTIRGRILGIAPNACLILESNKGTREEFAFKEIAYIIS
ncbi:MAG: hypothetical protein HUJ93_07150 [Bacteroidales bacterium]|nr:hypothetical protein [Bacteroidales bacterium]